MRRATAHLWEKPGVVGAEDLEPTSVTGMTLPSPCEGTSALLLVTGITATNTSAVNTVNDNLFLVSDLFDPSFAGTAGVGLIGAYATFVVFAWRDEGETEISAAEVAKLDRANRAARNAALRALPVDPRQPA